MLVASAGRRRHLSDKLHGLVGYMQRLPWLHSPIFNSQGTTAVLADKLRLV